MRPALAQIELTDCDREPIHLSGAVQPHGVLVAFDADATSGALTVVQASENAALVFGIAARAVLGLSIERLVGAGNTALIRSALAAPNIEDANPLAMTLEGPRGTTVVDVVMHRSGGQVVLEFEPVDPQSLLSSHEFVRVVRRSIDALTAVRTIAQLCDAAVDAIARLTGFDRVMVYRFDVDWHGEVIAEHRAADMEPFLNLHYPASDIPRQAREIFRRNWLRFIPDVGYVPVPLVSGHAAGGAPLDLARSMLRSVSPLHVEYLRNMGVAATMTVSLLRNGELWGLITCHHRTPKLLPYQLRSVCEIMGRTMSLNLGTIEENEGSAYQLKLHAGQMRLLEAMTKSTDVWGALASTEPDLLSLVGSDGAAMRFGDECRLIGRTPKLGDVIAITDWLAANESDDLFVSDALALVEPRFEPLADTASGIIALALSRTKSSYILWFRPELPRTVNWGGDPGKAAVATESGLRLLPRASFAKWSEIVRLHSRPWTQGEVDAAREWRRFVGTLIADRAAELERANRELDSFAHIASHDLKEPLRGIHNYASFLIEDYGDMVGEDGRDKLQTLVRLSRRMEALIDSLLALSGVGRAEFSKAPVDLRAVIDEVVELYRPRLAQLAGGVTFVSALPLVFVDGAHLSQIFNNLISNALKYSERPPQIEIGIDSSRRPKASAERVVGPPAGPRLEHFTTVFVRDNGIGIREKHLGSIFAMFKRLHGADSYGGGTGAGLAIAKKIVELYRGQMWAESSFGSGTTFYLTLPTSR